MAFPAADRSDYDGFAVDFSGGIVTLSLNRPEVGNALPSAAIRQMAEVFTEIASSDQVRVLLIRGEGDSFCAGGDVKGFAATIDQSSEQRRTDYWARMDRARVQMEAYIDLPCPIVVACQGAVAGAAVSFPLGADIALAEPSARFVFPHQRLGLPPDGGLSYLLPRAVGIRKATELALTTAVIDAAEALRIGIVSRVVAADLLQAEARATAERIAGLPVEAVRRARRLLRGSLGRTPHDQLSLERDAVADAVASDIFVEGVRAFVEKRKPDFLG